MKGRIIILGASPNPNRTSFMATKLLGKKGYDLLALGNRHGYIENLELKTQWPNEKNVDAITIFLKPERQKKYYHQILNMHPRTIIFNPGTENEELEKLAKARGIKIISCCTIALMAVGML